MINMQKEDWYKRVCMNNNLEEATGYLFGREKESGMYISSNPNHYSRNTFVCAPDASNKKKELKKDIILKNINSGHSMVIVDINGLYKEEIENIFKANKYDVRIFDLSDPAAADVWDIVNNMVVSEEGTSVFSNISKKKTVLFLVVPDHYSDFQRLESVFITATIRRVLREAETEENMRCKIPTDFVLDEIENIAEIPNLLKMISISRSRDIGVHVFCHSMAALRGKYPDDWAAIPDSCYYNLLYGAIDAETRDFYSRTEAITNNTCLLCMPGNDPIELEGELP